MAGLLAMSSPAAGATEDDAAMGGALVAELQGSVGGPLGRWGIDLGYDHHGSLALGVGLGINREWSERHSLPPVSLFARWLPWHSGGLALGMGAGVGRQFHDANEGIIGGDGLTTSWHPGYRADGSAVAIFADDGWSFRLDAGLGYFFTNPTCTYANGSSYYSGDCDSSSIAPQYRHPIASGRIVPTVTAAVGLRFGGSAHERSHPVGDLGPSDWVHAVLLGDVFAIGAALLTAAPLAGLAGGASSSSAWGGVPFVTALLVAAGVGTSLGAATGVYVVGRHTARPNGSYRRTLLGSIVGAASAVAATTLVYYASRGPREREEYAIITGIVTFATLPAGLATSFYRASAVTPTAAPALVGLGGQAGGVSVGIPSIALGSGDDIRAVRIGLVGGSF